MALTTATITAWHATLSTHPALSGAQSPPDPLDPTALLPGPRCVVIISGVIRLLCLHYVNAVITVKVYVISHHYVIITLITGLTGWHAPDDALVAQLEELFLSIMVQHLCGKAGDRLSHVILGQTATQQETRVGRKLKHKQTWPQAPGTVPTSHK